MFPSAPQAETPKSNLEQKGRVGRPRKTEAQKAIENISSSSVAMLSRMKKQVKDEYKHLVNVPAFSFDADGYIVMPPVPGPPEKTNKKRKRSRANGPRNASDGEDITLDRSPPSVGPGSDAASVNRPTAKRKRILQLTNRANEATPRLSDDDEAENVRQRSVEAVRKKVKHTGKGKGKERESSEEEDVFGGFQSPDEGSFPLEDEDSDESEEIQESG